MIAEMLKAALDPIFANPQYMGIFGFIIAIVFYAYMGQWFRKAADPSGN